MSAQRWPDHDWRADEYTLIRGRYAASVRRAWCSYDSAKDPWQWLVFRTDRHGPDSCQSIVPEEVKQNNFTREGAIAAAEAFIAERQSDDKIGNVYAFAGAPYPSDDAEVLT